METPSPSLLRICQRCGKWVDPEEVSLVGPETKATFLYRIGGGGSPYRFQCHHCTRFRQWREAALWLTVLALGGGVLLLERLGVIK
jgi:hypothetical protein